MTRSARTRTTYIILGLLIASLSLYIGLRRGDRLQYVIPALETVPIGQIDRLEITRGETVVTIVDSGQSWRIQPADYPADPEIISRMLSTVSRLELSDLASVTGNYGRYDLDGQARIRVSAYGSGELLRRFDLGKASPSLNQTFVRIDGDDRVFQVRGTPGSIFGLSDQDLRDRLVLSFDPETITRINVQGPDLSISLRRASAVAWSDQDGNAREADEIHQVLETLADLDAFRFMEGGESLGSAIFSVALAGDASHTLEVYPRRDNLYPARSSGSDYPFELFFAVTEDIMEVFTGEP